MTSRGKDISDKTKVLISLNAAAESSEGKIHPGKCTLLGIKYGVTRQLVSVLFHIHGNNVLAVVAVKPINTNILFAMVKSKRGIKGGRRPPSKTLGQERITRLAYDERTTYRWTAYHSGIPALTIHRNVKCGMLKTESTSVKPKLSKGHKAQRLQVCLNYIIEPFESNSDVPLFSFPSFEDFVHMDEKIFRRNSGAPAAAPLKEFGKTCSCCRGVTLKASFKRRYCEFNIRNDPGPGGKYKVQRGRILEWIEIATHDIDSAQAASQGFAAAFRKYGQDPRCESADELLDWLKVLQENCIYASLIENLTAVDLSE
ncbi:hypothetical protein THRCLA_21848 [Thraustotheca clavata]|uniref:Uncharacterized protein n=1 Tax=Thraustotheca clavata TaxID=74557 RepID=A0A1V9ZN33_9STRA|nr:hypothetical protein THRCLA_21848 [Thraustotheca clavata]